MVDRLVAMAFIPNSNPEEYTEVNHINGREKKNNNINNLEWCSHSYNMKHAYDNNLHRKGEDSPLSIYSEKQIRQVCELLEKNQLSYTGISFETSVAIYTIISILQHKKWTHISKNYNIDNYNMCDVNTGSKPKYKIKDIKTVCQLLEDDKMTMNEISKVTKVGFNTIADIKRRRTWKKISNNYNF